MKRKVWVTSPIAYIMAGIMFLMALASLSQNLVLCFVELALAVICLITVFIGDRWFGEHVARSMAAARRVLTAEETRMLEKFTLPVAVVANEKDIVWANELFEEAVSHGECRGDSILRYIYPYTLRQILAENGIRYYHITTSEISISVTVAMDQKLKAAIALCRAFHL